MSTESIQKSIADRFAQPLPEFYKRRIIFWYDEDGAFAGVAEELTLEGVKVLTLTGTNSFEAKMLLTVTDIESDYLVYNPVVYQDLRDNWLLDIELYSEPFRADHTSMLMEEIDLAEKPQLRTAVKACAKFFDNKERRAKFAALGKDCATESELKIAVMAVLAGARTPAAAEVIAAVLIKGKDKAENTALDNIRKFGNIDDFWQMVSRCTGYVEEADKPLAMFCNHVLLTALSHTMDAQALAGLETFVSPAHRPFCYVLVQDLMHSEFDDDLYSLCRDIEEELDLPARFDKLETADLLTSECFPCINESILRKFLTEISDQVIRKNEIEQAAEKRRLLKWYKRVRFYYEGILNLANMQQFFLEHPEGFHTVDARALWKRYTDDYYKMDAYYRNFLLAFGRSLRQSNTVLEDLYKTAAEYAEGLYKNWFMKELGANWTLAVRDEMQQHGTIADIPAQSDFFRHEVKPLAENGRVFVIISDGLRYDVAAQLAAALTRDTKGNTVLKSFQSVFPSTTAFGMAALLPHEELRMTDDLTVTADGLSTEGTAAKNKVLNKGYAGSMALQYKEFIMMKKNERRDAVSEKSVVYIYHNCIDAVGDKAATEDEVLEACETAVSEITNLVRAITNDLSGTNIIITADHGFIYTRRPLAESDKAGRELFTGNILSFGRRFAIAEKEADAEYMTRVSLRRFGREDLTGFAPQENIRIRMKGGGENYVHGGISPQESVIPVILFRNLRADSKKYVEVQKVSMALVTESRKISNSIFSLDFYQKEPVGGKLVANELEIYMTDEAGEVVSDKKLLIADKTSTNTAERVIRVKLTLRSRDFDKNARYYLVTAARGSYELPQRTAFSIDIAFASDFDF